MIQRAVLRRIHEGECLPRWYGVAWYDPITAYAVVAPLGVHLVLAWLRAAFYWVKVRAADDRLTAAYAAGHRAGLEIGRAQGALETARAIEEAERRGAQRVLDHLDRMVGGTRR